jgi:HK97 family phage prohead protease
MSVEPIVKKGKPERRFIPFSELKNQIEERAEGQPPKIIAQIALFNRMSEDLGGFRERIAPGCFSKTIERGDIRALMNHDPNYVLGRNKSGTMKLWEDEVGLNMECEPPDTTWARDLLVSMRRKDIDQCSFAFRTINDSWDEVNGEIVRTLLEAELYDSSIVTYPAYTMTSAYVRSLLYTQEFRELAEIIDRVNRGERLEGVNLEAIDLSFKKLRSLITFETDTRQPDSETESPETNPKPEEKPVIDEARAKARLRELNLLTMQMQTKGGH